MRTRTRGRSTILKALREYVNFVRFAAGLGYERVVETDFAALDGEIKKLVELADTMIGTPGFARVRDAADRLALVVHDLKARSYTPADYVRERTRIYRDSWVNPLIDELEAKEKKR
jgi:hypothetical protein